MTANYQSGFGNEFASEAIAGALPRGQNSPQKCAFGLYAEQLSGTAFTAPRAENRRSWLYRIRPSVLHGKGFRRVEIPHWITAPDAGARLQFAPLRWSALPIPNADTPTDFVAGMRTISTAGDARLRQGAAANVYVANAPMQRRYFVNADAEMLIVPQHGAMEFFTEMGRMQIAPGEMCVVPRGVKFNARPFAANEGGDGTARGYVCENYGCLFRLPELGAIGANGLASPRDFLTPCAAFEDDDSACELVVKWGGKFHCAALRHSPLDVVAWHGNYAPYKYDLRKFSPLGSVAFDHPDPSIFTVLTSPSALPGTANADFVIFPERWMVAEHTFRPPWYHLNVMSEFMGLIYGEYDAKPDGFAPGGMSLHPAFVPHGPDAVAFERASEEELQPRKLSGSLAMMFETHLPQVASGFALGVDELQEGYAECWEGLPLTPP